MRGGRVGRDDGGLLHLRRDDDGWGFLGYVRAVSAEGSRRAAGGAVGVGTHIPARGGTDHGRAVEGGAGGGAAGGAAADGGVAAGTCAGLRRCEIAEAPAAGDRTEIRVP